MRPNLGDLVTILAIPNVTYSYNGPTRLFDEHEFENVGAIAKVVDPPPHRFSTKDHPINVQTSNGKVWWLMPGDYEVVFTT